jgi:hypothetical protein
LRNKKNADEISSVSTEKLPKPNILIHYFANCKLLKLAELPGRGAGEIIAAGLRLPISGRFWPFVSLPILLSIL